MAAHSRGQLCSLIGVEGGHSVGSSLPVLRALYEVGVRYLTLTSTCNTPWWVRWVTWQIKRNPHSIECPRKILYIHEHLRTSTNISELSYWGSKSISRRNNFEVISLKEWSHNCPWNIVISRPDWKDVPAYTHNEIHFRPSSLFYRNFYIGSLPKKKLERGLIWKNAWSRSCSNL